MAVLTHDQKSAFWRDGYIFVDSVVEPGMLAALQRDFNNWVEESRKHKKPWGETVDGRPRFDVEPTHSAEKPALRRVNSPVEVSESYFKSMSDSKMTDIVACLIGPNVKYHHSKINSKLPGAATAVKWHQDFPFTPHSNDDIVTALLFVDEVTAENGPLEVVAGSHKGEIHSLWHGGKFTAAVSDAVAADAQKKAVRCLGPAGGACFMHTRLLHGSAPNMSRKPRTLFITVYSAEDASPYAANPVPSRHEGLVVRGVKTNRVRSAAYEIELPQKPSGASFFAQQAEAEKPQQYNF